MKKVINKINSDFKPILFIFAAMILVFSSCKKKDEEAPEIEVKEPAQESVYKQGDSFRLHVVFTDNKELKQYKIDIHHGAGHDHGSNKKTAVTAEWEYEDIDNLEGEQGGFDKTLSIPSDAETGEYDIIIQCTDASGLEAEVKEVNIDVEVP